MKKISENSGRNKINGFEEYSLRRKKRAIWTAAGCVLAALMVVGISFALRSQGRALDETQLVENQNRVLVCNQQEHTHNDDCYVILTCGKEEHTTHEDGCYEKSDNLACEKEEHTTHEDCYNDAGELTCEKEHTTHEDCYNDAGELTCEKEHTHEDGCYVILTCEKEHTHDVGCYETSDNPTCEIEEHTHNDSCYSASDSDKGDENGGQGEETGSDNSGEGTPGQGTTNPGTTEEPTYEITSRKCVDDKNNIEIEVSYDKSALIPDQAELVVRNLTGNEYKDAIAQAENALKDSKFDKGAFAYDISFIGPDGKEIEPKSKVNVTFHFKNSVYEDGDDLTIVHVGEDKIEINEEVEVKDGKSTIKTDSFSPYVFGITRPVDAQNISDSVVSVDFSTRQGSIWIPKNKEADGQYHFNSDDSVKATFKCQNIQVSKLGSGAYIPLPKSISFPKEMIGKTVVYNDANYSNAGTYQLLYDTDGTPCAFFEFTDDYLKWVKQNRGGYIKNLYFEFEFTWDVGQTDGEEKKEDIYLGDFAGTVKIKTKDESNDSDQNLGYNAYKNVKETKYEDGKMLITYEIYVNVQKNPKEVIKLSDTITYGTEFNNLEWEYYGNSGNDHDKDYVKFTRVSDTEKTITIGNTDGVDAGSYTIRYTASFDVGKLQDATVDSVKNTITYGNGKYHSSIDTDTRTNPMTKSGNVEDASTGEVKWTVRINDGRMPYTFGKDEEFKDTLPVGTSLVRDTMKIIQYDANWKETNPQPEIKWQAVSNNGTTLITATLPAGAYRYQIEYTTMQNESPKPGATTTVENKAEINGDINYDTSVKVTLQPPAITKTMGKVLTTSKEFYTKPDGTKREVFEIEWSVALASVMDGEEYTDRGLDANWVAPLLMSPEQINKIVVKCGQTTLEKGKDYEITAPNGSENFLFKIKFKGTQKDKVTIDYTCYADVTDVTDNGFNVRNVFGDVEAGNWISKVYKSQSTNLFKYVEGSGINEYYFFTNSKIAIGTKDTLNWVIVAEPNCHPNAPLEFKDTLPEGLSFVDTSLKITADGFELAPTDYKYQIDKNVITLKVDLAGKTFGGWKKYGDTSDDNMKLFKLVIKYDTKITDPADGGKKDYTNTVEWDNNKVEQNVTVTRDVIGKNGSYDESNGVLSYSVIINPDGADLNPNGNLLRVEDTLTDRKGIEFELSGVKLYSLTDDSGKKVRGDEIKLELLPEKPANDGSAEKYKYYYDKGTYTFTAFIPDQTGYELVYDYRVMSDVATDVEVSNKATLYGGSNSYGSTQTSTKVLKFDMKVRGDTQAVTELLVRKVWKDGKDGSQNIIQRLNGKLTFDLYRKKVKKSDAEASGYTEGSTFVYKLTDADLEMIKNKDDYEKFKASQEEYMGEYTLETSNGDWKLTIGDLAQLDETGSYVYQYYLVETSMDTLSGNDQWLGVEYEVLDTDKDPVEIIVTNTIVSDYSLPETGAGGSWTDRIIGWFKNIIGI